MLKPKLQYKRQIKLFHSYSKVVSLNYSSTRGWSVDFVVVGGVGRGNRIYVMEVSLAIDLLFNCISLSRYQAIRNININLSFTRPTLVRHDKVIIFNVAGNFNERRQCNNYMKNDGKL